MGTSVWNLQKTFKKWNGNHDRTASIPGRYRRLAAVLIFMDGRMMALIFYGPGPSLEDFPC